jgi:hypothetical protein
MPVVAALCVPNAAPLSFRRAVSQQPAAAPTSRAAPSRVARRAAMATPVASAEALAPFEFASAGRIVFGRGEALKRVPAAAKAMGGTRALIVVGTSTARAQPFADALNALGVSCTFFSIGACRAAAWRGRAAPQSAALS